MSNPRDPWETASGEYAPCPFCSSSALETTDDVDAFTVGCADCLAVGPAAPTAEDARQRWNHRGVAFYDDE